MVRVVRPGGTVAAYVWDMMGGGHPLELMHAEMRAMGFTPPLPPASDVSRREALQDLWASAGLSAVDVREITVQRTFADFDDFWTTSMMAATVSSTFATMPLSDAAELKTRMRRRLSVDEAGRITCSARAIAIRGCVSK